jgi:sugar O-acyltransferase (sialic acid O-acetyltransferase NeuD family)
VGQRVYIAGTGTFAAEIADWAADAGVEIGGLIALQRPDEAGSTIHDLSVIGLERPPGGGMAVLGLGGDRRAAWASLAAAGWEAGGVVHPTAHVSGSAEVAPSATIGPRAVVGAEARVGEHAILSRGALVGHHTRVGDYATLNPGVNVGGNAVIGEDAFLGMGCVVVNGVDVGAGAIVAAGGVAIRDVAAKARVQGVPARPFSS